MMLATLLAAACVAELEEWRKEAAKALPPSPPESPLGWVRYALSVASYAQPPVDDDH